MNITSTLKFDFRLICSPFLDTKYSVVKKVGRKIMNFRLSSNLSEPWDIM